MPPVFVYPPPLLEKLAEIYELTFAFASVSPLTAL